MIQKRDSTSLLGAIGMGLCPVLMATALSTIGLGVLAPVWMWLSAALLVTGLIGYALDYRYHHQSVPVILFVVGALLLWAGRYSPLGGTGWQGWPLWGSGACSYWRHFALNLWARSHIRAVGGSYKWTKTSQDIRLIHMWVPCGTVGSGYIRLDQNITIALSALTWHPHGYVQFSRTAMPTNNMTLTEIELNIASPFARSETCHS
jgi:hypothetical protein